MTDSGVRLSEVLMALSLATDLGFGRPAEHMLRAARIGMRIGERMGLDRHELATLYDVSILTYVGCPVYGNEAAALFGDDIDFRAHAVQVDLAGFPALVFILRRAGSGTSALNRARQAAGIMASGGRAWSSRWPTTARRPANSPPDWDWHRACDSASSRPTPGGTGKGSQPS
jgi:hypothetical protein